LLSPCNAISTRADQRKAFAEKGNKLEMLDPKFDLKLWKNSSVDFFPMPYLDHQNHNSFIFEMSENPEIANPKSPKFPLLALQRFFLLPGIRCHSFSQKFSYSFRILFVNFF
jgi:hypothetical protein